MFKQIILAAFALGLSLNVATAQKQRSTTTTTTNNSNAIATNSREKTAVQTFGLSIIEAYFRRDCDFVWTRLADPMRSVESGQTFAKTPDLKTELCGENPLRTDISVSYQMYQQNYQPRVLTQAEFAQQYPQAQQSLQLQAGDYYFDGSQPKQAGATSVFRASDMARFVVRKNGNSWLIIAM